MIARIRRLGRAWGAAMRFLTTIPWGRWERVTPDDLGCAAALFPWVGGLLGVAVWAVRWGVLAVGGSASLAAALALAAWVALTGGLHLDGLMDAADGLFGGRSPEHRLEIMRDERAGAFGVLAAVLVLLVKYAALETAPAAGVIWAPVVGRWALTAAMAAFPYARKAGLGRMWFDQVDGRVLLAATAGVMWMGLVLAQPWLWAWWAVAAAAGWLAARWTLQRVPGLTGDVYGALAELTEALVLVLSALWA
ncbi:MAG: adenosylcobinamide-GDP ribazoletransferase [Chloroflexi bacterium]|nr:adenosylcobinamide-GDP ribazoletransferase [Chloroflexota bacterium]